MHWSLLVVEVILEVKDGVDLLVQVSHLVDWISFGEFPVECEPFGGRLPDDFLPQEADDLESTEPVIVFVHDHIIFLLYELLLEFC